MVEGLKDVDVVMMFRLQCEWMDGGFILLECEYYYCYGLDVVKFSYVKDDVIVMYSGFMNCGVEIDGEIVDDINCLVIQEQVEMGVVVCMVVMDFLVCNL